MTERKAENMFEKYFSKIMSKKLDEYNQLIIKKNNEIFKIYNHEHELSNLAVDFIATRYYDLTSEEVVKKYYTRQGVKCIKVTDPNIFYELPDHLKGIFGEMIKDGLRGAPDFICFDPTEKTKDFFFVESKSNGDTLKQHQFLWIYKHPQFKVKIIFLSEVKNG